LERSIRDFVSEEIAGLGDELRRVLGTWFLDDNFVEHLIQRADPIVFLRRYAGKNSELADTAEDARTLLANELPFSDERVLIRPVTTPVVFHRGETVAA
jgi:hypothetical protein